jgi:ABC-2 type transport system permease protein
MSSADLLERPVVAPAAYRGTLWRQVRAELRLVFRRRRNVALLVVLCAVPVLIGVALRLSNTRGPDGNSAPSFLGLVTDNGLFLAFAALTACLPVFLPLAVAVVGGDAIAGEASAGTLRYLLTVPVSRGRLLAVKAIGVCAYIVGAVGLVCLVGIITGSALFGVHDVVLLSGDTVSQWDGLLRTLGVCVFVFCDLLGLAAMALFFSTMTEVPVGAMAATIGSAIAFTVLDAIPALNGLKPLLLTHHWLGFADLVRGQVDLWATAQQLALPLAYTAIFGSLAWARITSADVTS